ncbi:TetR/AcrR family transcriptional regulator [Nocardiopsis sp. ARC36]
MQAETDTKELACPPPRRTRSDALQNRERLLEVAAQVFAEQGLDTAPAAVAKKAGVGVGTLYRHFPTREALIEAAYRRELTHVCEKADVLLDRYRPSRRPVRGWRTSSATPRPRAVCPKPSTRSSPPGSTLTATAAHSSSALSPRSWRPAPGTAACEPMSHPTTSCSSWAVSPIPYGTPPRSAPPLVGLLVDALAKGSAER